MIKFSISRDSWHYAYYQWVCRMYGHDPTGKYEPASLCPYFQTMLWGSVFFFFSIPSMVFGWVYMRLARYSCRWGWRGEARFLQWVENKTRCIDWLDDGPKNFTESPIFAAWAYTIMGLATAMIIACVFAMMGGILYALGLGVFNFSSMIDSIVYGLASIGWFLFMGFYWVGKELNVIWTGVAWLFTNGEFWYWIGSWAVILLAWLFGTGIVCLVIGVSAWSLSKIPAVNVFLKRFANLLNGFPEAKKARKEREMAKKAARPKWECFYCEYINEGVRDYCSSCTTNRPVVKRDPTLMGKTFIALFGWIAMPFVWLRGVKDRPLVELSSLNMLLEFLSSIKQGVCPMVQFVDPGQLQAEAKAKAAAEAKEEAMAQEDGNTE